MTDVLIKLCRVVYVLDMVHEIFTSAQIVHIGNAPATAMVQNAKNIVNGGSNQISQNNNVWIDGAGNVVNNNTGTVMK